MDDVEIFKRFRLALAIGLLFGVERGWHRRGEREGGGIAGVRTNALAGLLGGVGGWLVTFTSPVMLAVAFLACAFWYLSRSKSRAGSRSWHSVHWLSSRMRTVSVRLTWITAASCRIGHRGASASALDGRQPQ